MAWRPSRRSPRRRPLRAARSTSSTSSGAPEHAPASPRRRWPSGPGRSGSSSASSPGRLPASPRRAGSACRDGPLHGGRAPPAANGRVAAALIGQRTVSGSRTPRARRRSRRSRSRRRSAPGAAGSASPPTRPSATVSRAAAAPALVARDVLVLRLQAPGSAGTAPARGCSRRRCSTIAEAPQGEVDEPTVSPPLPDRAARGAPPAPAPRWPGRASPS